MNDLAKEIHQNAKDHGFWKDADSNHHLMVASKIALIHSEISEALEDYRSGRSLIYFEESGKPCGMATELADALIRILDMMEFLGIDTDRVVGLKMEYNKTRPMMHGKLI
jgi:NTP pyrophosphatase (non-canonical NTP hydrolase)